MRLTNDQGHDDEVKEDEAARRVLQCPISKRNAKLFPKMRRKTIDDSDQYDSKHNDNRNN